jgi:hypothetical protein
MTEPAPKPDIHVRGAHGLEVKLCRMLLGNEGTTHPDHHLFIAVDKDGRPQGAGCVRSGLEAVEEPWGVHFQALPGLRDNAPGRALLDYARAYAASYGAMKLQTLRWFERGSVEELNWTSLGFWTHQFRYAHEIDASRGYERLTPLIEQVRDRGWIPENARIISLAEANLDEVLKLHVEHLGGTTRQLRSKVDGTAPHSYDRQASLVLLCGDKTMGLTLGWFPSTSVCEVAANVLHPAVRLGWADIVLKYEALKRVTSRGATRFRFCTAEKHTDSRRSLEWVGGGTTRAEVRMQIPCRP